MVKTSEIERLYRRMDEMNEKIEKNNEKLEIILEILQNKVTNECKKMSEHIDFIENVYDVVKNPLGYVCSAINSNLILPENEERKEIENEKE